MVGKNDQDTNNEYFLTPYYGQNLHSLPISLFKDKRPLSLSLLATLCSVGCIQADLHDRNICLYQSETSFDYRWTIRVLSHLFEFTWTSHGMVVVIDWEHATFPKSTSFSSTSSSSSSTSLSIWEAKIGNLREYGVNIDGFFTGEQGMLTLLHHLLTYFDASLLHVKYCRLTEYEKVQTTVTSLLEVFPTLQAKDLSFDEKTMNRWNRIMSTSGKNFKSQKFLTKNDIGTFQNLFEQFSDHMSKDFYDIPSDTGLVVLTKKGKLVATKPIEVGEVITHVPITRCETFSNWRVWVASIQGTMVKKASPFCGFGGFVQQGEEKVSNCTIQPEGRTVCLVATKRIAAEEEIVCCEKMIFPVGEKKDGIIEDLTQITSIIKAMQSSSHFTRSEAAPAETAETEKACAADNEQSDSEF